jgi:hypothetical protein
MDGADADDSSSRGEATCNGLVKPDIVFFGEKLPQDFFSKQHYPAMADLVLVLGTSLSVHPFASLPNSVPDGTPRVLFNLERVGNFGRLADDVLCLGDCDTGIRKLADELGWRDELEAEWRRIVGDEEAERQLRGTQQREKDLEGEVARLAVRVEEALCFEDSDNDGDHGSRGFAARRTLDSEVPSPRGGERFEDNDHHSGERFEDEEHYTGERFKDEEQLTGKRFEKDGQQELITGNAAPVTDRDAQAAPDPATPALLRPSKAIVGTLDGDNQEQASNQIDIFPREVQVAEETPGSSEEKQVKETTDSACSLS